ncbi:MAG: hypothetical protein ACQEQG_07275 [Bacillota bacterium]
MPRYVYCENCGQISRCEEESYFGFAGQECLVCGAEGKDLIYC